MVSGAKRKPRGMSLAVVMAVVAVMAIIAATMAAVSMMSLNFTQRWYNASVALNEAEAGIAELMYNVADDARFGMDETREIRARLTDGYDDKECWHVVTFRKGSDLPWSVNNLEGSAPEGYGGRAVPSKMVHAWSTGYCRGMYRTIEVLIEKPPFPFALATSGSIRSKTPLQVEGTRTAADYAAGRKARPGHICANSPLVSASDASKNAIYVRADASGGDASTFISGFAQAVGGIRIEDGEVVGGVRPKASKVTLPDINIAGFRMAGEPGVIALSDADWPLPKEGKFVLDAMYDREGDLRLNGPAVLQNAFIFVNGNLTVGGSLTGTGAVVVTGNVTINGDASIASSNRVALLSGGRVTLNGSGSYFQGLVYSKGPVSANKVTVLGNMIVAGGPSTDAALDGVKLVSDQAASDVRFIARSSSSVTGKATTNKGAIPAVMFGGTHGEPGDSNADYQADVGGANGQTYGWLSEADMTNNAKLEWMLTTGATKGADNQWQFEKGGRVKDFALSPDAFAILQPDATEVKNSLLDMQSAANTYQDCAARLASTPKTITQQYSENGVTRTREVPNPEYERLLAERDAAATRYDTAAKACVKAVQDYYKSHASSAMTYDGPGKERDIAHDFTFDINQYISDGARLKVIYWHVYGDRR